MAKKGKRYQEAVKLIDHAKKYEIKEAIALLKETAKAKFDETVEVAFRLGVNPKKADEQIRGAMVLPNGTGRTQRVLVFAKGDKVKEAEAEIGRASCRERVGSGGGAGSIWRKRE